MILEKPVGLDSRTRYEIVVARKRYRCDDYPASHAEVIKPGDHYLVCTEFPGGESGYADSAGRPVRLRICAACAPVWTQDAFPKPDVEGADRG